LLRAVPLVRKRITGDCEPRGVADGAWMEHHKKQNFLYENIEDVWQDFSEAMMLELLSFGDGLRPGALRCER